LAQEEHEEQHHHLASCDETRNELNQQQVLLSKLEELVKNLTELVARLEPRISELPKVVANYGKQDQVIVSDDQVNFGGERLVERVGEEGLEGQTLDGETAGVVTITKYSPMWSERFQFVSAVKLGSDPTCINVLPFRDFEGLSKYVAIGDHQGRIYVFLRNGEVVVEFQTSSYSPITSMASYLSAYKNESVLVTGHQDGAILAHKVKDVPNAEDWTLVSIENVGKFASPEFEEGTSPVTILEVHHLGRLKYIISSDMGGKIRVFTENGTIHGSATPRSKPLAFLKQRLLFLTESGAGSLDLRSMKITESECEGLNHSLVQNYVFDVTERSKAYGYTSDGDLIHVLLLGDIMNFKCRVRSKRKFDVEGPLVFQAVKGYLLIVNQEQVFVYNVSSQHYVRVGGPRFLFSADLDGIRSSFLNYQAMNSQRKRKQVPLIASDREKLVVVGLGSGYIGMYRSNLPIFKGDSNAMLWTSPVLFFIIFLFGAWLFFAKKKEALTSWGPDDPFSTTSATTGAPLGSGSGDRPFADSTSRSSASDIMELRAGGLRGPGRRYGSPPSRYPPGATSSFRPSAGDSNSRPASVDPNYRAATSGEPNYRSTASINNFCGTRAPTSVEPNYRTSTAVEPNYRTSTAVEPNYRTSTSVDPSYRTSTSVDPSYRATSELKYRGSTMEPPGFPKRRENLFLNNKVVDDGS
ncbi:hypothetical protein Tsubulata_016645, partial [Turnera subulata]